MCRIERKRNLCICWTVSEFTCIFKFYAGENSEDEKKTKLGSFKKAISNSFNKGRKNSKVMDFPLDDIDAEELKSAQEFRQVLIAEDLLPSNHDDIHTILRLLILPFDRYEQVLMPQFAAYELIVIFIYDLLQIFKG